MSLLTEARKRKAREGHVPGEVGIWVFVLGDMLMFAVFFGVFLYYRADDPALFERSQQTLNQGYGAINTIFLLTSSLFVVLAVAAVRRRIAARHAPRLLLGAVACALGFATVKVLEYSEKINADLVPATNDFYMCFYIFTGVHFLHLLIGTGVLAFMWRLARKPEPGDEDVMMLESGASYWHMVDLLWIVLFPLLYLTS